ncbi:hypothetical protein ACFCT7_13255 [Fulvivirgaceae bacterium LMO-SS25]
MEISKSYNYYFIIIDAANGNCFFDQPRALREYYFNFPEILPSYLKQGTCDPLSNRRGVLFFDYVLASYDKKVILSDFKSCLAFNLPLEICDIDRSRIKKNYSFNFDLDIMRKEISSEEILNYNKSCWKPILEVDPDFFYLKNGKEILLGSKDYKQVLNWAER